MAGIEEARPRNSAIDPQWQQVRASIEEGFKRDIKPQWDKKRCAVIHKEFYLPKGRL